MRRRTMKIISYEDALDTITKHLDRINNVSPGTMKGVARVWLKDVPVYQRSSGQLQELEGGE
jgi:hypothetical protein